MPAKPGAAGRLSFGAKRITLNQIDRFVNFSTNKPLV